MTKPQLDALQSYISSVVRVMGKYGDHSGNVRLLLDSKARLEAAFGQTLPTDYPDLFGEQAEPVRPSPFAGIDLL